MVDVSNRTLVVLLAVSLTVIIVGTVFSLNKLDQLGVTFTLLQQGLITGAQTGSANITITGTTSLTLYNNSMNFGSGRVNLTCDWCGMDSNGISWGGYTNGSNTSNSSAGDVHACCTTFTDIIAGFLLENTGNVNISVGYTCTSTSGTGPGTAANCTHTGFIGGTRAPGMGGLEIRVVPQSDASLGSQIGESTGSADIIQSCRGGGVLFRDINWNVTNASDYTGSGDGIINGTGAPGVYRDITNTGHWLCGNSSNYPLMPDNAQDAGLVDINITIPGTAVSGTKGMTLVFNGTSSA